MIYEYSCEKCQKNFDVIKSVQDIDVNEFCPTCENPAVRVFVPRTVYFSGEKVTHAEYNPGLGCVVKNKRERDEIAKRKGLVEIGNDYKSGETLQKHYDTEREIKREKRWEED